MTPASVVKPHWLGHTIFAFVTALFSATQDVSIDAFRIESAPAEMQGALAAAYQLGYRIALLVAGAGVLYISEYAGWAWSYCIMAALMGVGITTVLIVSEPVSENNLPKAVNINEWLNGAFLSPFSNFFGRFGRLAIPILLFVAVYRVSDISMGVMANPFYVDLGFTKTEIANVIKVFGFTMTITGTILGGFSIVSKTFRGGENMFRTEAY